jgi:ribosomal protein S18 acetylase RimI-like enzyme
MTQHFDIEAGKLAQRVKTTPKESKRRMLLLRKSGLFGKLPKGVTIERAVTFEELNEAYHLVHDVFVEQGYITPQPGGVRNRSVDLLPSTVTFIAKLNGKIIGVISIAIDDLFIGLPSDGEFKAELDLLRAKGGVVCEVTNQAVAPDFRRTAVTTELMRYCVTYALYVKCTDLIATVSPKHATFYKFLGFEGVGNTRSYSVVYLDPVTVLDLELTATGKVMHVGQDPNDPVERFLDYYFFNNPHISLCRRVARSTGGEGG